MTGTSWLQGRRRKKNKKRRGPRGGFGPKSLTRIAQRLREIDYPSERWFRQLWMDRGMLKDKTNSAALFCDQFNIPVPPYIPDVVNFGYKYIIEIDGKCHARRKQRDINRDNFFLENMGIQTFRIPAFNLESFNTVCELIRLRREAIDAGTFSSLPVPSARVSSSARAKTVTAIANGESVSTSPDPTPWRKRHRKILPWTS